MENLFPTEIKLHMVWVGRGDGFILEFKLGDTRKLVLIDGGPGTIIHKKKKGSNEIVEKNGNAPFYKHYVAAIRQVWGQTPEKIDLDIVNSHADEDHYMGLVKFINEPGNGDEIIDYSKLVYFMPYLTIRLGKPGWDATAQALGERGMYPIVKATNFVPGLVLKFPNNSVVAEFRKRDKKQSEESLKQGLQYTYEGTNKGGGTWTNQSSIIMTTKSDPEELEPRPIIFTGDSSVFKILPHVEGKHFAIYKIQHHGAILDSSMDGHHVQLIIPDGIKQECVIFALLGHQLLENQPMGFSDDCETIEAHPERLEMLKTGLQKNKFWGLLKGNLNENELLTVLAARRRAYITTILTGGWKRLSAHDNATVPPQYLEDPPSFSLSIESTWKKLLKWTGSAENMGLFWDGMPQVPIENRTMRTWFHTMVHFWASDELTAAFRAWQTTRYYSSFKADAYVVSGSNIPNGHPNTATIVGIAASCLSIPPRQAALYMTDATVLNRGDWRLYARAIGKTPADLFNGNGLRLFHLDKRSYMTLDGSAVCTQGIWGRESEGFATRIEFAADFSTNISRIQRSLNSSKLALNPDDAASRVWRIVTTAGDIPSYLGLGTGINNDVFKIVGLGMIADPPKWRAREEITTYRNQPARLLRLIPSDVEISPVLNLTAIAPNAVGSEKGKDWILIFGPDDDTFTYEQGPRKYVKVRYSPQAPVQPCYFRFESMVHQMVITQQKVNSTTAAVALRSDPTYKFLIKTETELISQVDSGETNLKTSCYIVSPFRAFTNELTVSAPASSRT